MLDFIIFYMIVGYIVNNIIALFYQYSGQMEENEEFSIGLFIINIPMWPYILYSVIKGLFEKDE